MRENPRILIKRGLLHDAGRHRCGCDGQRVWVAPGATPHVWVDCVEAVVVQDRPVAGRVLAVEHAAA